MGAYLTRLKKMIGSLGRKKIPYCIVSVSDKRSDNIEQIKSLFGYEPEKPQCYNAHKKGDVERFLNTYRDFDVDSYLSENQNLTQPHRNIGERGCWMSHYSIWSYMLSKNMAEMIVTEDDLHLEADGLSKIIRHVRKGRHELFMAGAWTEFYYLNNAAARVLSDHAPRGYAQGPVDEYLFKILESGAIRGMAKAGIVRQRTDVYGSDIDAMGLRN